MGVQLPLPPKVPMWPCINARQQRRWIGISTQQQQQSGGQQLPGRASLSSPASSSAVVIIAMAREEEHKRIDLKVNVSCCDGCRSKVMKAMSLKGVLRTEIQPSHDRVTVVGDVDVKVLVRKLAKVGKIAEVLPVPVPATASEEGRKRGDDSGGKKDGDRAAQGEEKYKGKDDGRSGGGGDKAAAKAASSKQQGCKKCAREAAARAGGGNGDHADAKKAPSKDAAAAAATRSSEEGGDADAAGFISASKPLAPDHHAAPHAQVHYHRAEPAMVVPVHVPAYYPPPPVAAAASLQYGYYGMPPPAMPVPMPMGAVLPGQRHPQQPRPQASRFDEDFFNDDNTVGCSVM